MHAGLSTALLPLHLLLLNLKPVQLTCAAELCKSDFKLSLHSGAEGEEPTTGREERGGGKRGVWERMEIRKPDQGNEGRGSAGFILVKV